MLRLHRHRVRHLAARLTASLLVLCLAAPALAEAAGVGPSTATSPASPGTYTVKSGDSISLIATKMKVKMKVFMEANGLTINSILHPGDVVIVPAGGTLPTGGTPAAVPVTYTVRRGDSLIGISSTLKVRLRDLLAANKLTVESLIYPGMLLVVPGAATPAAGSSTAAPAPATPPATPAAGTESAAPLVYVVVAGDFLGRIASRAKVSLRSLLEANKLSLTSVIHPGDRLVIPAGGVVPGSAASSGSGSAGTATPAPARTPVQQVLDFALAQRGKPYKFFTAGPETYDCSGLTMAAFAVVGISLPHYSAAQSNFGSPVEWTTAGIRPGDLVFLETSAGSGVIGHVGIAVSATEWVQAPRSGDVVKTSTIPQHRIVAVRRLIEG